MRRGQKTMNDTPEQKSGNWLENVLKVSLLTAILISPMARETVAGVIAQANQPAAYEARTQEDQASVFQEGRGLIARQEWAKAAEKFTEFARKYPQSAQIDAAQYWLAFALNKQGRFQEADQVLATLQTEFPHSSWKQDAETLRIEIAPRLGNTKLVLDQVQSGASDETRLVALQSLFEIDVEQALVMAAAILKEPHSATSQGLQEGAVALAGERGGEKAVPLLLEAARAEFPTKIRVAAIVGLKNSDNEKVLNLLQELATNSDDDGITSAALFALSEHRGTRATEILHQIALSAKTPRNRKQALYFFSLRGEPGIIESLAQSYDAESDETIKAQLLAWFSESKEKAAVRKLMDVARHDQSLKLRQVAIHFLSRSSDPEARKFVQEIK
jgi:hypothetical protein